jgi:hypothetical protein
MMALARHEEHEEDLLVGPVDASSHRPTHMAIQVYTQLQDVQGIVRSKGDTDKFPSPKSICEPFYDTR